LTNFNSFKACRLAVGIGSEASLLHRKSYEALTEGDRQRLPEMAA
jgi:hypothetical protein